MDVVFSTAYWPPIACFAAVKPNDVWVLEQYENFQKQTYRSRCSICGANGPLPLVVPVLRRHGEKTPIKEVLLDLSTPWQQVHWRAIMSAYSSSPYFEYFADDVEAFYRLKGPVSLLDYNTQLLRLALNLLEWNVKVVFTQEYNPHYEHDYRNTLPAYEPVPYYQVFARKQGFVPGQSVLDLIFNEGPESWRVLEAPAQGH